MDKENYVMDLHEDEAFSETKEKMVRLFEAYKLVCNLPEMETIIKDLQEQFPDNYFVVGESPVDTTRVAICVARREVVNYLVTFIAKAKEIL